MEDFDRDVVYLEKLAKKYKAKSINKKNVLIFTALLLLLAGATLYSTMSAVSLSIANYNLERTLDKYTKPASYHSPITTNPSLYTMKNISFDFIKPLPDLIFPKTKQRTNSLELPPALLTYDKKYISCSPQKAETINFSGNQYHVIQDKIINLPI